MVKRTMSTSKMQFYHAWFYSRHFVPTLRIWKYQEGRFLYSLPPNHFSANVKPALQQSPLRFIMPYPTRTKYSSKKFIWEGFQKFSCREEDFRLLPVPPIPGFEFQDLQAVEGDAAWNGIRTVFHDAFIRWFHTTLLLASYLNLFVFALWQFSKGPWKLLRIASGTRVV